MYIPFDSWNTQYKREFGARPAKSNIFFRILVKRDMNICKATLTMTEDGGSEFTNDMFWAGMEGDDCEWWDVTFVPDSEGLYFYYFTLENHSGQKLYITRDGANAGEITRSVNAHTMWQQTVYEPDYKTPDWLKGGIIYQIFPDRFCKNGEIPQGKIPSGRILRDDWGGLPEYRFTPDGKILNNDYFGGNLSGIIEKLPYLAELSVSCIYLNPIFEAHSNHRYDTADYEKIDPLLGDEKDFAELCKKAEKLGIRVILDGVFSHTGADSKYFNKQNRYDCLGAYNSKQSPYYNWFKFNNWPDDYVSWWGINILPEVVEECLEFIEYISGDKGIAYKWQKKGAAGYRLDVADELPDLFLDNFRKSVKNTDPNAVIIGEVWEDASNKFSYGQRRRYLLGKQLDSVMNYPFYNAIVSFIKGSPAQKLNDCVMGIIENYPPQSVNCLMNHLGTHDTERIITLLAGESCEGKDREWQAHHSLDEYRYTRGKQLLKLASAIQYTLPGVPSLYYADEAGQQGYKDPFNRMCYPWGGQDGELVEWYKTLGKIRRSNMVLKEGSYHCSLASDGMYMFERNGENGGLLVAVNRNDCRMSVNVNERWNGSKAELGNLPENGLLNLSPMSVTVLSDSINIK